MCDCRVDLTYRAAEPTITAIKYCATHEAAFEMATALRRVARMRKGGQYTYDRDESYNLAVNALRWEKEAPKEKS